MNATPQCYDYEVASPGWSFFYDNEALPDERLGIAQLSNRLLIPPDALPFQGNPNGEFLGYTYMALPFTEPVAGEPPTGDQAWTCFLSAANFKGPIAYYIPETWSKIGKLFNYPFIYGRGLDARPGIMGGGAMEINTVPAFESRDAQGIAYSKLPDLRFPVDGQGRTLLVQDVTYYSKAALYDAFKAWRDGGPACSGQFRCGRGLEVAPDDPDDPLRPGRQEDQRRREDLRHQDLRRQRLGIGMVRWDQERHGPFPAVFQARRGRSVGGPVRRTCRRRRGSTTRTSSGPPRECPTRRRSAGPGAGPAPSRVRSRSGLADGSIVTYSWYRFVDQPSFQQYAWSAEKKAKLQAFVEKIHAAWTIDRDYMAPPRTGKLVDARSGPARDAAQGPGGRLRPHRHPTGGRSRRARRQVRARRTPVGR